MTNPRQGMVEIRRGKRGGGRYAKAANPSADTVVIERAPAGTLGARKIVTTQAVRKVFIATVHDSATDERLAELERKVGLVTRFGTGADLNETTRLEKSRPFLKFVERLARKAEPARAA
ncbi:hypothetical protein [Burkholderia ubonensis]|uniref:hypothetical protein n=1 Tax=Burkholderia ubonensis TaxID=101571 RepID=UPI00075C2C4B|nr:hypothetical protein [Burkholderia ubonensis]AOI68738.1 hypothetical protein WI31_03665 [Burkholderia ubonensis]KUZ17418.1 hypothetical protein WI29_17995 [Burkholderia ubonensis]KUZ31194.1 hypothetical protein WI32_01020 [Burkholderia ubonensis]KUZ37967.1 hypothetical protein WI30_04780 [Burkholderia ubonensis]KUZ39967.1 hypothetical protein WI33_34495 [Burkholderia ubonensis]